MSDVKAPPRKRFFVNGSDQFGEGAATGVLDAHTQYIKPARQMLAALEADSARTGLMYQFREREQAHGPVLVNTRTVESAEGTKTIRTFLTGATVRAIVSPAGNEIWVDAKTHEVEELVKPVVEEDGAPYLWVGARIVGSAKELFGTNYPLIVAVFDPDGSALCTSPPLQEQPGISGTTLFGGTGTGASWLYPNATAALMHTDSGLYLTTAFWNSFFWPHWLTPASQAAPYTGCLDAPYDPLVDGSQITPPPTGGQGDSLWGAVAVLDPRRELAPSDTRGLLPNVPGVRALPGNYVIKVGLRDLLCQPATIEIEVRVNKAPYMIRRRYHVTCDAVSGYFRNHNLFGAPADFVIDTPGGPQRLDEVYACEYEYGPNPHYRNWWQGAILADVVRGSISTEPYYVPANGFEPGPFPGGLECTSVAYYGEVCFFGLHQPGSGGWIGPTVPVQEVAAVCSFVVSSVRSASNTSVFGLSASYPIASNPSYWIQPTAGTGLDTRVARLTGQSIDVGTLYMIVAPREVDAGLTITPINSLSLTDIISDPNAYMDQLYAIGFAASGTSGHIMLRVPGSLNLVVYDGNFSQDCAPSDDSGGGPSPAVEVEIPAGE